MLTLAEFARKVIGAPFLVRGRDYTGVDCYGLVYLAYRDVYGLELPLRTDYESIRPSASLQAYVIEGRDRAWRPVDKPLPGDVVLLRCGAVPVHCALALGQGDWMLHTENGSEAVLEKYTDPLWANRVEGFWRHDSR